MQNGGSGASGTGSGVINQAKLSVLSLPPRWKGNQSAGAGLCNLGNSCYLNSTLQCLAYIPPLAHLCLNRIHSSTCPHAAVSPLAARLSSLSAGADVPCTFCIIERQISALLRGSRSGAVSPAEMARNLHLFNRSFVRGRQEDSHELLTAILDVMERDSRRPTVTLGAPKACRTIVEDLFQGRWQSQVRCLVCGHESNTYEPFTTLPLDIGQARSVMEGLRAFTEGERLDGSNKYRCDKCRQMVPAVKKTTIWDDPNVLVVHLKRFDAGSLPGKITRHVGFTDTLDLQPFMTPLEDRQRVEQQLRQQQEVAATAAAAAVSNGHHHHHHGQDSQMKYQARGVAQEHPQPYQKQQHTQQKQDSLLAHSELVTDGGSSRSLYLLTGVLVHQGTSIHSGHYYALVRDSSSSWSCMNDSLVYGTSLNQVQQEQAYILFYTRQSMKLPTPAPFSPPLAAAATRSAPPLARVIEAAAAGPTRHVYGPQLPAYMTRGSVGNITASPPVGIGKAPVLPLQPSRLNVTATPSARLPAKATLSAKAAPVTAVSAADASGAAKQANGRAVSGDLSRRPDASAARIIYAGPAAASTTPAVPSGPSLTSTRNSDNGVAVAAEARKRKRQPECGSRTSEAEAAAADERHEAAEAEAGILPAIEREVAGLKACASWKDGIKRLKVSMEGRLRDSGLPGAMREVVMGMLRSGLNLQQVLALGRCDPRRRELHSMVPPQIKTYGTNELWKMLRPVLMLWSPLPTVF